MSRLPSLADIVGPVTVESSAVLCFIAVALCIIITTAIAKRRSRRDVENEFELAKIKEANAQSLNERRLANEQEAKLFGLETTRQAELEKVRAGLLVGYKEAPRNVNDDGEG